MVWGSGGGVKGVEGGWVESPWVVGSKGGGQEVVGSRGSGGLGWWMSRGWWGLRVVGFRGGGVQGVGVKGVWGRWGVKGW